MSYRLVAACLTLITEQVIGQEVHIPLHDGWQFQQVGESAWYPAIVPGVVQTDLLRNGLIPDPYLGANIDSIQWIENEDWIYKRTITVTDSLLKHGHLDLVFKGLDTFAEIHLNDSLLGKADNMFRAWEWPVKDALRLGSNELKVVFRSPIKEGAKLRDAYGIQLPHDNDPSGVSPYIRKAAYQFGWDFCPRMVTSGIWQEVELRGWDRSRIVSFEVSAVPLQDSIALHLRTYIPRAIDGSVRYSFDGTVIAQEPIGAVDGTGFSAYIGSIASATKWWPLAEGEQDLHIMDAELLDDAGRMVDRIQKRIGVRSVQLIEEQSGSGSAFKFRVNGRDIFIKGCNLVPPSLLLPTAGDQAWVDLVNSMRTAGMNMVRVWAGGVYPPETFYSACDTAGILVWQDFMVANMVPGNVEFKQNLISECDELIDRLRHHPCLALFCGDNELQVAWNHWGWRERYALHGEDSIRVANAYKEVHRVLAIGPEGQHFPYTPTSPLSNWGNAEGLTKGDLHYWGVWHGDSTFASFKNNVGRFVSEYGFQSYPDSALLAKYVDPNELYIGSPAVTRLQRSYKTDKPIWAAIDRELGEEKPSTLGGFIQASQRAQAKAYGMAIEAHMASQPHCMGTLLWQLNDCWPGPSWSIMDFEGNPKPAYEVVRKLYTRTP